MLVGRGVEIELLTAFVTDGSDGDNVLVLTGEPGVGKTALLTAAVEVASWHGVRVVRAEALEYEAELHYVALNQLLQPATESIDSLEEPHRSAMRLVMGSAAGTLPSQLVAGAATLALLRAWVRTVGAPVLLVVDDVQWLDLSSSMALIYALRRLTRTDIRLVAAVRADAGDAFTRSGFRILEVAPLDDHSAEDLLRSAFPALPTPVRGRLRTDARGNPLALLELPAALQMRSGSVHVGELLPLTRRLQQMFAGRLEHLPDRTRQRLLLIVLAGTEDRITQGQVPAALQGHGDLEPAERAGIVHFNPRTSRPEFRHPLLRSAVVELSTSEERRTAHRILADAFAGSPQRRAWHLGQAATEQDEDVAASLEAVSQHMLRAGDSVRATATMVRAAELSPDESDRVRRTARAAYLGSLLTGEVADTGRLLRAATGSGTGRSLEVALAASFQLLHTEGDVATASRLLLAALRNTDGSHHDDPDTVVEALHTLLYIGFYSGRQELWPDIQAALDTALRDPSDTLSLLSGAFADTVHAGAKALPYLDAALDDLRFASDPVRIVRTATAGAYLDRIGGVREPLQRVIEDGGAVARSIDALFLLGNDDLFSGDWDHLIDVTTEGLRLCAELGYSVTAGAGRFLRGLVAAARGEDDLVEQLSEQLLMWAAPRNLVTLAHYASHIRCGRALGNSDFADAYRHAVAINPPGVFLPHNPHAVWLVLELTEAAARSGRVLDAQAHARAAKAAGLEELSPRLAMVTTAALALAHPEDGAALFEQALAVPGAQRWVFDRARIELLYGEHLRRVRATTTARLHLSTAATIFTELRATPWIRRTQAELRAAGETVSSEGSDALTARERSVAELAAAGMTNKQIGEQLFLSARTVSTHLHHVFHKLGITRRGALRDALDRTAAR
ncbi:helix-turn-helix transcriptional regulator [Nocardia tengchongensis]|uniref:helix-turn-helix transcriptional regulator n=1 Tax=Nocardia tengchongensis TaxID=2055889 RepID=UPI0036954473